MAQDCHQPPHRRPGERGGVQALYRTNRAVELTPAGKAFYSEILPMLEHYRRALEKARTAYSGPASALRLGIGQFEMGFVSQLFKEFHSLFPDIRLSVSQYPYSELMRGLEDGTVDVIFSPPGHPAAGGTAGDPGTAHIHRGPRLPDLRRGGGQAASPPPAGGVCRRGISPEKTSSCWRSPPAPSPARRGPLSLRRRGLPPPPSPRSTA